MIRVVLALMEVGLAASSIDQVGPDGGGVNDPVPELPAKTPDNEIVKATEGEVKELKQKFERVLSRLGDCDDGCGKAPFKCIMCAKHRMDALRGTPQATVCTVEHGFAYDYLGPVVDIFTPGDALHSELEALHSDLEALREPFGQTDLSEKACKKLCEVLDGERETDKCKSRLFDRFYVKFLSALRTTEGSEAVRAYMNEGYERNREALNGFAGNCSKTSDEKRPVCKLWRAPDVVGAMFEAMGTGGRTPQQLWCEPIGALPTVRELVQGATAMSEIVPLKVSKDTKAKREFVENQRTFGNMVDHILQLLEVQKFFGSTGYLKERFIYFCSSQLGIRRVVAANRLKPKNDREKKKAVMKEELNDIDTCKDLLMLKLASDFVGVVDSARKVGEQLLEETEARKTWFKTLSGAKIFLKPEKLLNPALEAARKAKAEKLTTPALKAAANKAKAVVEEKRRRAEEERRAKENTYIKGQIQDKVNQYEAKERAAYMKDQIKGKERAAYMKDQIKGKVDQHEAEKAEKDRLAAVEAEKERVAAEEKKRKGNMLTHMKNMIIEKLKKSSCFRRFRQAIRAMATRLSRS